jgi:hypothetical protein
MRPIPFLCEIETRGKHFYREGCGEVEATIAELKKNQIAVFSAVCG